MVRPGSGTTTGARISQDLVTVTRSPLAGSAPVAACATGIVSSPSDRHAHQVETPHCPTACGVSRSSNPPATSILSPGRADGRKGTHS